MRVQIYIDGSNFYYLGLKPLGITGGEFDFDTFAQSLAGNRIVPETGKRYYTGTVSEVAGDPTSKLKMGSQVRLFNMLKSTGWRITTNKLRKRDETLVIDSRVQNFEKLRKAGFNKIHYTRMREKGIDVAITTDLLAGAADDHYDTAILVSSDTDFIPAIDWVRNRFKKRVEYVGFQTATASPVIALIERTDSKHILREQDLLMHKQV